MNYLRIALYILIMQSCTQPSATGYTFAPDMAAQRALAPYSGADSVVTSQRSIPRDYRPYLLGKSLPERALAAQLYALPVAVADTARMSRAAMLYNTHCALCHGTDGRGRGQGSLIVSGKYSNKPADLRADAQRELSSAELYHVVSAGFNLMKGMPIQLRPADRWRIVEHVQVLQREE